MISPINYNQLHGNLVRFNCSIFWVKVKMRLPWSVLNVRSGNQLAEPTAGQIFDRVPHLVAQRNDSRDTHIPSSVRLSIGSQWKNQIFTIKRSLPASHIFLIIVSLSSPLCSQFSTCFFRESYLHCSKFSIRFFDSST